MVFARTNPLRYWMGRIAYLLTVIGGIILFVAGILGILGLDLFGVTVSAKPLVGISSHWILILAGLIAMILSHRANHLISAIILIIIGFFAGGLGNWAGILLIVGGIIGLIGRFV